MHGGDGSSPFRGLACVTSTVSPRGGVRVLVARQDTHVRGADGGPTDLEVDRALLPRNHNISDHFEENYPPVARFRLRTKRAVAGCVGVCVLGARLGCRH